MTNGTNPHEAEEASNERQQDDLPQHKFEGTVPDIDRRNVLKIVSAGAVSTFGLSNTTNPVAAQSVGDLVFEDDFEDGNFDWTDVDHPEFWKESEGEVRYTPTSSAGSTGDNWAYANETFDGETGLLEWPVAIEFKVYASDTSAGVGAFATNGGAKDSRGTARLGISDSKWDNEFSVWNSEGDLFTLSPSRDNDTWYTYRLVPDLENDELHIERNGESWTVPEPGEEPIENTSIALSGQTCWGCGGPGHRRWEYIKVWDMPAESQTQVDRLTSFEEENVGDQAPADPLYLWNDAGIHEVSDDRASHKEQSFRTADATPGTYPDPSAIAVDLDLTDVEDIIFDIYVEKTNPSAGNIKVSLDNAGTFAEDMTSIWNFYQEMDDRIDDRYGGDGQWWEDMSNKADSGGGEVKVANIDEVRTLIFWIDGDQDVYWDNIRLVRTSETGVPVAEFTFDPEEPIAGDTVVFDASASEAPEDAEIEEYQWDFTDDGEIDSTGIESEHTFEETGDHPVTLTVVDGNDREDTTEQTISINETASVQLREEKLTLAQRLDEVSVAELNEYETVNATLEEIFEEVEAGNLSVGVADEAMTRMLLGEGPTQDILENIGPNEPEFIDPGYNIAGDTAELSLKTMIRLSLSILSVVSVSEHLSVGGNWIQRADSLTDDGIEKIAGDILGASDEIIDFATENTDDIAEALFKEIASGTISGSEKIQSEIETRMEEASNWVRDELRKEVEIRGDEIVDVSSVDKSLDNLSQEMNGAQIQETGLTGSLSGARKASSNGTEEIRETLEDADTAIAFFGGWADNIELLSLIENITEFESEWVKLLGKLLQLLSDLVTKMRELIQTLITVIGLSAGYVALEALRATHNRTITGVIEGETIGGGQ